MVRQQGWSNSALINKIRRSLTIIQWIVIALLIYINRDWLNILYTTFFN